MSRRGWVLFGLMSVIWGVPYLLIKVADDGGVSVPVLVFARVAIGSAVLLPLAIRRGQIRVARLGMVDHALKAVDAELSPAGREVGAGDLAYRLERHASIIRFAIHPHPMRVATHSIPAAEPKQPSPGQVELQ